MVFKAYLNRFLIIDGYNVLNALRQFEKQMSTSLEDGRTALNELLIEYAALTGEQVVVVYDAYKGRSKTAVIEKSGNLEIVFTKENETADSYIESLVNGLQQNKRNLVRVVTSDWAEQQIVLGSGATRLVPKEFYQEFTTLKANIKEVYAHKPSFATLEGRIDESVLEKLEKWRKS